MRALGQTAESGTQSDSAETKEQRVALSDGERNELVPSTFLEAKGQQDGRPVDCSPMLAQFPGLEHVAGGECTHRLLGDGKAWLDLLSDSYVTTPSFVLQLDVLDGDRIGVGVQVGQSLVFRDPAAEQIVGDHQLSGLVVHLNGDRLAKVLERRL